MDPARRVLLRVDTPNTLVADEEKAARQTARLVERLMGRKPELRFAFIQGECAVRAHGRAGFVIRLLPYLHSLAYEHALFTGGAPGRSRFRW